MKSTRALVLFVICAGVGMAVAFYLFLPSTPPTQPTQSPQPSEPVLADKLEANLRVPFDGDFDAIVDRGYMRVLVPFSKTGYFIDKGAQRGNSYELTSEFGKFLDKTHGKKMRDVKIILIPTPRSNIFTDLSEKRGDLALGNLTITEKRQELVTFSNPLLTGVLAVPVTVDTVTDINSPEDLSGKTIYVRKSASYFQSLEKLNERLASEGKDIVNLEIADERLGDEDLLEMIAAGAIPMTIVDQHKSELWLEVLKGLKTHPKAAVRTDGEIAIAARKNAPNLLKEVNGYVETVKKGTRLGNILFKRYLQEASYLRNLRDEGYEVDLDKYQALFEKYGNEYDFDWLLIAAQSFQESKFDPKARSRAGAVGLMQIKPSTAEGNPINIKGISADPEKNVQAGVKYLRYLADQYFPGLSSKDANQVFFALAAYNAGPSRFKRLREKAKKKGYDPDKWFGNVEWIVASEIGRQPVDYVGNIYQYYVVFHNERLRRKAEAAAKKAAAQK
ncbi:Membrane-bound lytic murein transglycosylase F precursor [Roseibium album]|nr:Membrane-bound lytic murein transglycosylase F precursor [Roseibium album]